MLKYVLNKSSCGSFDFQFAEIKKKIIKYRLQTTLCINKRISRYYSKNKVLYFKNLKRNSESIYFEVIFGDQKIINNYFEILKKIKAKYLKNFLYKKFLILMLNSII